MAAASRLRSADVITLHLVRHGQASYGGAVYDQLSPLGRQQAAQLGPALRPRLDAVYSGPHERQRDTAAALTEAPLLLPEFAEYPAFELLRASVPDLAAREPAFAALAGAGDGAAVDPQLLDRAFVRIIAAWAAGELNPDGIERYDAFCARVQRGLMILADRPGPATIAAVTSAGPISVALALATGAPLADALRRGRMVRNASVTTLHLRRTADQLDLTLLAYNDVAHLPADHHTHR